MMITESTLRSEYLDFVNDYLTVELFAEHREISVTLAMAIIDEGRKCHEIQVKHSRICSQSQWTQIAIDAAIDLRKRNQ